MKSSSQSSNKVSESGNSITDSSPVKKQISPSKRWAFTMNNYIEEEYSTIVRLIREYCKKAIVAKEVGKGGTPHLQGYLEFTVKRRPRSVFKMVDTSPSLEVAIAIASGKLWPMAIHWEKAKGTLEDNLRYCSKDDKNPFVWGCTIPKEIKEVKTLKIEDLYDWQKELVTIFEKEPDERKIYWYWSHKGGIGKTVFSKFLTMKYGAICLHGKGADVRNGVLDYYNKNGDTPGLIVYPIPRCHGAEYCSYESLENVKDMYFYSGKYEGGQVCGNPPHLIVFANEPPNKGKMSLDRWDIVCIDPENAPEQIYF